MKFKQTASALLILAISLSAALAGCTTDTPVGSDAVLTAIAIDSSVRTEYTVGDTFNEASVTLTATYDTGAKESLKLTSAGVTYTPNPLTFDEEGDKTLTVTYTKGEVSKSDSVTFHVLPMPEEKALISSFAAPETYSLYQSQYKNTPEESERENRDKFMTGGGTYKVGDDNGFVFKPETRGLNENGQQVIIENAKTTFELYLLEDEAFVKVAEPATYVSTKEGEEQYNIYYFTEEALGKVFRLVITLDAEEYDVSMLESGDDTITAEVEIVDGYNVYNQLGLSVFDTLNVNHWHDIKAEAGTLPWDEKPLIEYNNITEDLDSYVSQIVLHTNLNLDPDELPENYFWDKDRDIDDTYSNGTRVGNQGYASALEILEGNDATKRLGFPDMLNGSLRDYSPFVDDLNFNSQGNGRWTEIYDVEKINMQKGLYNSTGTGIAGNCMEITYTTYGEVHSFISVLDGKTAKANPLSHWALFKYPDEGTIANAYPELLESSNPFKVKFSTTPVVENLRLVGFMPRQATTDGEAAHLMAFNTCTDLLTLKNTLISRFFLVCTGDKATGRSSVDVIDSKCFDIYNNMLYSWRADIHVTNSILKDAGGPIFILCDGSSRTGTGLDDGSSGSTNYGPNLVIDELSEVESYAGGEESWYKLNSPADELFMPIKSDLGPAFSAYLGKSFVHTNDKNAEVINIIAIIIPEPENIATAYPDATKQPQVSGMITRGENEIYKMNSIASLDAINPQLGAGILAGMKEKNAPIFVSGSNYAIFAGVENGFLTVDPATQQPAPMTATAWAQGASDWLMLLFNASIGSMAQNDYNFPWFAIMIGDVN